jgi:hypothetical protein
MATRWAMAGDVIVGPKGWKVASGVEDVDAADYGWQAGEPPAPVLDDDTIAEGEVRCPRCDLHFEP